MDQESITHFKHQHPHPLCIVTLAEIPIPATSLQRTPFQCSGQGPTSLTQNNQTNTRTWDRIPVGISGTIYANPVSVFPFRRSHCTYPFQILTPNAYPRMPCHNSTGAFRRSDSEDAFQGIKSIPWIHAKDPFQGFTAKAQENITVQEP